MSRKRWEKTTHLDSVNARENVDAIRAKRREKAHVEVVKRACTSLLISDPQYRGKEG